MGRAGFEPTSRRSKVRPDEMLGTAISGKVRNSPESRPQRTAARGLVGSCRPIGSQVRWVEGAVTCGVLRSRGGFEVRSGRVVERGVELVVHHGLMQSVAKEGPCRQ